MTDENFDPKDHDREPREKGWKQETEKIIYHLRNRGDQRIGQLIINALRRQKSEEIPSRSALTKPDKRLQEMSDTEFEEHMEEVEKANMAKKAQVYDFIWNMEADEMVEALEEHAAQTSPETN